MYICIYIYIYIYTHTINISTNMLACVYIYIYIYNTPPGRKFRHAAYNIDVCRGEAESPKTRFTWPAWRSNYFPGINLYYYIVPGGELCKVVLGVYGGKGVNMW